MTLNGSDGTLLILPTTTAAQTIQFNDKSLVLQIANEDVLLGAQVVGSVSASIE